MQILHTREFKDLQDVVLIAVVVDRELFDAAAKALNEEIAEVAFFDMQDPAQAEFVNNQAPGLDRSDMVGFVLAGSWPDLLNAVQPDRHPVFACVATDMEFGLIQAAQAG